METEYIGGLPVDNLTYAQIEEDLAKYIEKQQKMIITSVNPQITLQAQRDSEVRHYIERATHRIPDGVGVVLMSRLTGGKIRHRVTGVDVMNRCLEYANLHECNIFLYGAKHHVVKKATENIKKSYPKLKVSGYLHGYTTDDAHKIVAAINSQQPTFLFVALGSPKQEIFLERHLDEINAQIFLDVGGTFDVLAGEVQRAPDIFIKLNLEWLYRSVTMHRLDRLMQIPQYIWKALKGRHRTSAKTNQKEILETSHVFQKKK